MSLIKHHQAVVIGLGPASVSTAIYLKRFNVDVLVIGLETSALNQDIYIDNYYGLSHVLGKDLFNNGLKQLKDLNIEVLKEEVISIDINIDNTYLVKTKDNQIETKTIFLGLGKVNQTKIKGAKELIGKGVSACAICDGYLYRNKTIALIGKGSFADSEYEILQRFTKNITRFETINSITKEDKSLIINNDNTIKYDGIFLAEGMIDTSSISKHLGIIQDEKGYIEVNTNLQTNLEGIYAGGDAIGEPFQVSKAVENGMRASISILKYLKNKI